jgi:hypothetical protein
MKFLCVYPNRVLVVEKDLGCLSRIRLFSIPDSNFFPSRILDPGPASKNLSILTQKNDV